MKTGAAELQNYFRIDVENIVLQVLAEIFDYLSPEQRQRARQVCSGWNYVISQLFEVCLHPSSNENDWQIQVRTEARFPLASIENISYRIDGPRSFVGFCSSLLKLELKSKALGINFLALLQHCLSLKELILEDVRISSPPRLSSMLLDPSQYKGWLPNLEVLGLGAYPAGYGEIGGVDNGICELLAQILSKGKLTKLILQPNSFWNPLDFTSVFTMSESDTYANQTANTPMCFVSVEKIIGSILTEPRSRRSRCLR
jgi:hypothetical protein